MGNIVNQVQAAYGPRILAAQADIDNVTAQIRTKAANKADIDAQIQALVTNNLAAAQDALVATAADKQRYDQAVWGSENGHNVYSFCGGLAKAAYDSCNITKFGEHNAIISRYTAQKATLDTINANINSLRSQSSSLQADIDALNKVLADKNTFFSALNSAMAADIQNAQISEAAATSANVAATSQASQIANASNPNYIAAQNQAQLDKDKAAAQIALDKQKAEADAKNKTVIIIAGVIVFVVLAVITVISLRK